MVAASNFALVLFATGRASPAPAPANASCNAWGGCVGLLGDCCPYPNGEMLACCSQPPPTPAPTQQPTRSGKCADWAGCETLSGYCCPHEDGSMLACCGANPMPPAPSPPPAPAPAPAPQPQTSSPTSAPEPPTPAPPTGPQPVASFIAVGDWGYNEWCHGNVRPGCQRVIAEAMKDFMESEGDRIKFIVNVGDSFYCDGVGGNDDYRWAQFWTDFYSDGEASRNLVQLPWYTVYGNHDMGKSDPCPCDGSGMYCHQTNNAAYPTWIMPNLTYHVPMPELNIEIIGLDTNFDWQGDICKYANCGDSQTCYFNLLKRTAYAGTYFVERYQNSAAKTLVVFSHYPVDYLYANSEILDLLPDNSKHDIVYFGGHRHNTDQNGPSIAPNTQWLVGGGGGYGCDGGQQGFVKGFVWADGTVTTEVKLVKTSDCCFFSEREDSIPAPATGSVDVVVCEWGNCTTSVLGQGICTRIHETGHFVKAWCETSSHVKVERMDDACDRAHTWHFVPQNQAVAAERSGRSIEYKCDRADTVPRGWSHPSAVDVVDPEDKNIQTVHLDAARNPMNLWV